MLTDDELNRIESQATHTRTKADTLALVSEVRSLRAELAEANANLDRCARVAGDLKTDLEALRPLGEAAVHYYCNEESDPDAHDRVFEAVREYGADFISRRAVAQQPSL